VQVEYWQLFISTISGFLIAFLAEPVKTFFTNRAKKASLRESIYREIAANYHLLYSIKRKRRIPPEHEQHSGTGAGYILRNLHQECYGHVLKETPVEFYQLEEAADINLIYAKISSIIDFIGSAEEEEETVIGRMVSMTEVKFFMEEIAMPLALGRINLRTLRKVSQELADDVEKNKKQYIGFDLMHYIISDLDDKVPDGVDKSEYLSSMFSQLVDEVAKGKKPEEVLPKIKAKPSKNKSVSIKVVDVEPQDASHQNNQVSDIPPPDKE
jgi:hypothetical protein